MSLAVGFSVCYRRISHGWALYHSALYAHECPQVAQGMNAGCRRYAPYAHSMGVCCCAVSFSRSVIALQTKKVCRQADLNTRGAPFAHLLEPRCAQSARSSSLGYHERPRKQPGACRDRSDSGSRCRSWRRDPDRSCRTLRRFQKGCRRSAPRTPARSRPGR